MKKISILFIVFLSFGSVYGQQKVGNNPTTINGNAAFEIESTNKGLLIPRLALTSTSSASPLSAFVAGMMVYNTATAGDVTPGFYVSNGSSWSKVDNQTSTTLYNGNGTLSGNRTVTQGANTLSFTSTATNGFSVDGTTFSVDAANNRVGIGTATPVGKLDVPAGSIRIDNDYTLTTNPGDVFTHNTKSMTHYGVGWYNDSWDAAGATAYLSGYAGLKFFSNGNARMYIARGGNIGIGNASPSERLDVTGNIRFSGALMPNNTAGTAGQVLTSAGAGAVPTWTTLPTATTYTGSTSVTLNGTSFERAALTGDVTASANSNVTTIATGAVTSAKILDGTIATADIADNAITKNKLENNIAIPGTANMTLPGGTTAERPVTPSAGMIRYNSTLGKTEVYQGGTWVSLDAVSTYTASNGLTMASNNTKLGGTLTDATTSVNLGTNKFNFASSATTGAGHFEVDGSTFSIDAATNRVGIGTSTPSQTLDVNGTAKFVNGALITPVLSTGTWIDLPTTGPSAIGSGGAGANAWIGYTAAAAQWFSNSAIGDIAYRNTGGKMLFGNTSGAASMALSGDKLGIGNIAPSEKLDVTGNIKFSGALMPNNTAGTSGQVLTSAGAGAVPTWTTLPAATTYTASNGLTMTSNNTKLGGTLTDASTSVNLGTNKFNFASSATTGSGHFEVDGSTFSIDAATNRVGFGTSTPSSIVHNYNNSTAVNETIENALANNYSMTAYKASAKEFRIGTGGGTETGYGVANKFFIFDVNNTTMRLVVDATGNVGIGTATPDTQLDVPNGVIKAGTTASYHVRTGAGYIDFYDNTGVKTSNIAQNNTNGDLYINGLTAGKNTYFNHNNTGKVGIGNSAPTEKLDVTGNVKFSGALMPNNSAGTAGQVLTSAGAGAVPTWTTPSSSTTLYAADGTLAGDRTVSQATKTLNFTSTAISGTSHFTVDGTTLNVDAVNNRVGIGTATPSMTVHIAGTAADVVKIDNVGTSTGVAGASNLSLVNTNSTVNNYSSITARNSALGYTSSIEFLNINHSAGAASGAIRFVTNNAGSYAERIRISNAGNLGVGTTAPNAPLQFANSLGRKIVLYEVANNDNQVYGFGIENNTLKYQVENTTANHVFYAGTSATTSSELARLTGTGNLGIGTSSPSEKLDVAGNVRFSGALMPNNTAGTAGQVLTSAGAGAVPTWTTPSSASNIYNTDGTLTGARTIDMGANAIYFQGAGEIFKYSGSSSSPAGINLGRTGGEGHFAVAASNDHGLPGSVAGDAILSTSGNLLIGPAILSKSLKLITANTERLTILPSGNVGISNTNPSEKLDVTGNVRFSGALMPNNTAGTSGQVLTSAGAGAVPTWTTLPTTTTLFNGDGSLSGNRIVTQGANTLAFTSTATNGFSVDGTTFSVDAANNRIGLGTSTPEEKLHFAVSTATNAVKVGPYGNANGALFVGGGGTSGISNWIDFYSSTGVKSGNIYYDNTNGFTINGTGTNTSIGSGSAKTGINITTPTATLDVNGGLLVRSNGAVSNQGTHIQWNKSCCDGATSILNSKGGGSGGIKFGDVTTSDVVTEWARFDASGNFGIGTASPSAKLSVNGTANNTTGSWGTYSDARIKDVTGQFTDGLNIIKQINPVKFVYKENAPFPSKEEQIGIVAQDLEKIAPYMVTKTNNGTITDLREVNSQAYVFLLINAIKEQQAQIEKMQKEIDTLKKEKH